MSVNVLVVDGQSIISRILFLKNHVCFSYLCLSGVVGNSENSGEARESIQTLLTVCADLCHPYPADVVSLKIILRPPKNYQPHTHTIVEVVGRPKFRWLDGVNQDSKAVGIRHCKREQWTRTDGGIFWSIPGPTNDCSAVDNDEK